MSPTSPVPGASPTDPNYFRPEAGVVEVPLLLSAGQASTLEEAAHSRGLTAGQMVRNLIQEFFGKFVQPGALSSRRVETPAETEYRRELLGGQPADDADPLVEDVSGD